MDRAERTGLGIALIGHVGLFAALSLSLLSAPQLPKLTNEPLDVQIVDAAALESSSPTPAGSEEPAPAEPAPTPSEAAPAEPEPVVKEIVPPAPMPKPLPQPKPLPKPKPVEKPTPKPVPKPVPKPAPKPVPKPAPAPAKPIAKPVAKPTPAKPAAKPATKPATKPASRPGLSRDILKGLDDRAGAPASGQGTKPAAKPATAGPKGISLSQMTGAQKNSLNQLIYTQLKPFWKPPSGADAELLVTRLSVRLNKDGTLAEAPEVLGQDGVNESNRAQAKLHAERAIQAVRRAAPFKLPPEYYDAWKWLKPLKLYVGQPG